ncbi:MAG: hypothetical protein OES32_07670 [Acidobacteriota bacterium]|nr:hypothetical protein [Acidobacteriota bacterium]MDH3523452.1 hypothetical protein [Acidobacteriota bacterium]
MKFVLKLVLAALGLLAVVWLVVSWFEAGKEIRVLCSGVHSGMEREHVLHTLETGAYLRYRGEAGPDDPISVDSLYNLRSTRCVIELEDGRVVSATLE